MNQTSFNTTMIGRFFLKDIIKEKPYVKLKAGGKGNGRIEKSSKKTKI